MSHRSTLVLMFVLVIASGALVGCRVDLPARTPEGIPLDDAWLDFAPPLSAEDVGAPPELPELPADANDVIAGEPEIVDIPDRRGTTGGMDRPPTSLPEELPTSAAPLDTPEPTVATPPVDTAPVATPAPAGTSSATAPPRPPPPSWDQSRDRKVDRRVFENGPTATPPTATTPTIEQEFDPLAPGAPCPPRGTQQPSVPPTPVPEATAAKPTLAPTTPPGEPTRTGDMNAPPAGTTADPLAGAETATPEELDPWAVPGATAPADPTRTKPPTAEIDPWEPRPDLSPDEAPPTEAPPTELPPVPTTPDDDDPWGDPAPAKPTADEPYVPGLPPAGAPPSEPATPASPVEDDDPWGDAPATPSSPPSSTPEPADTEDDPWGDAPTTPPAATTPNEADDDPWGDAPTTPPGAGSDAPEPGDRPVFVSDTREGRAMEQVTRLLDAPGDPNVEGFPPEVVVKADPWVALREGPRPMVLVFYDDSSRVSDRLAAEILPVLAEYSSRVDVVTIDRGPEADLGKYGALVVDRYLGTSDDVPVTVVSAEDRTTLLARFGEFPAGELEAAIQKAIGTEEVPAPESLDPLQPAGTPPSTPDATPPSETDDRTGFDFTAPAAQRAADHARKLRNAPENAALGGYPESLIAHADAQLALEPGSKPVVIVFFDDSSRASNLQAADILPTLVDNAEKIDLIAIDVGRDAKRTEAERKVVRPYYAGTVPATIVLSARRAPVKFWFQRTSGRALDKAIEEAASRR